MTILRGARFGLPGADPLRGPLKFRAYSHVRRRGRMLPMLQRIAEMGGGPPFRHGGARRLGGGRHVHQANFVLFGFHMLPGLNAVLSHISRGIAPHF